MQARILLAMAVAAGVLRGQTPVTGNITADTVWTLAGSPYEITASVAVLTGVTLTVQPGVEVRLGPAISFYVDGRLLAEGAPASRILFTRMPAAGPWRQILFSGAAEHRLAHCDIRHGDTPASGLLRCVNTRMRLEAVAFSDTASQLMDMQFTSVHLLRCVFPGGVTRELIDYKNMPAAGYAKIEGCQFGTSVPVTTGVNDIVDFVGNNRPRPIAEFIDNVFLAGVDDCFDMDGTDAHIEGNVFVNVRKGTADESSANAITTGAAGTNRSQLVICRNFFYDVEHALLLKDQGAALLQNNTLARIRPNAISTNAHPDGVEASGICLFGEPWRVGTTYGTGLIFEGNIADDLQVADPWPLLAPSGAFLQVRRSLVRGFPQSGDGNLSGDPLFVNPSGVDAFNIRQRLALLPASPCRGAGPNGLDMGAAVPAGASISGVPPPLTYATNATLRVAGPGVWAYRWRLDGGAWSGVVPLVTAAILGGAQFTTNMFVEAPVVLTGLGDGAHTLEVQGRNSAGSWHGVTTSQTWTVVVDADHDGMGDAWELANGLSPSNPADALLDSDLDGMDNRSEFAAGTRADDPASVLRAWLPAAADSLGFPGIAGKTYQLQSAPAAVGPWGAVTNTPVLTASGPVTLPLPDAAGPTRRYYRLMLLNPWPAP